MKDMKRRAVTALYMGAELDFLLLAIPPTCLLMVTA